MWALKGSSSQHKSVFDLLLDEGVDLHIRNQVLGNISDKIL